jgi:outer membrane immunogenic protein
MRASRRYLTGTTALVLSVGFAAAAAGADIAPMYTKAPLAPAYYNWTGCYAGIQAGYGWGKSKFSDPSGTAFAPPGQSVTETPQGGLIGGQAGCDYQFAGRWVAGIEIADAYADIRRGGLTDPFFDSKSEFDARTNNLGSVTGRVGYGWDRVLLYGKGGAAWSHNIYDVNKAFGAVITDFSGSDTRFGWTAGAGIEWAFAGNWSAKVEYNHYDMGSATLNLVGGGATLPTTIKQTFDTATIGVNYRFGHW